MNISIANPNIIMTSLWNPHTLLRVDPLVSVFCVGVTKKKDSCRNHVNAPDRKEASQLLNRMATLSPRDVLPELFDLAELTLCVRNHRQSQLHSMVRKWWAIIESKYPEIDPPAPTPSSGVRATLPPPPQTPSSAPPAATVLSRRWMDFVTRDGILSDTEASPISGSAVMPVSLARTTSLVTPPQSPILNERPVASSPATISIAHPTTAPVLPPAPNRSEIYITTPPAPSSAATPAALTTLPLAPVLSATLEGDEVEPTNPPTTASTAEISSSQTPSLTSRSVCPPTAATWLSLTPEPQHPIQATPCSHSSRRKPLTDECPICNEEIHCPDDAVWCRAQCGQNMHRGCFAPWRRECLDREANVTCVYCRALWKYEWEE